MKKIQFTKKLPTFKKKTFTYRAKSRKSALEFGASDKKKAGQYKDLF